MNLIKLLLVFSLFIAHELAATVSAGEPPSKLTLAVADDSQPAASKTPTPPEGFRWDKPVAGHASKVDSGWVLRNQSGRIWAGEGNRHRLLTLKPVVSGDALTIDVELQNASHRYEQSGLVLHHSDDAFVKFVVEHIDGKHYVVMGQEMGSNRKVLAKILIEGSRAELRLSLKEGQAIAQWRLPAAPDDAKWREASTANYPATKQWYFGLFSQDANPDKPGSALVRNVKLDR